MFIGFRINIIASSKRYFKPLSSGDLARGGPLYRARPFGTAERSYPYVSYVFLLLGTHLCAFQTDLRPRMRIRGGGGVRGIQGVGGGSLAKRIFLFHSVRKNRISLAPGFPENELANFRGFAEANFTREAYLTAEGDFTAASAARGGGSPRAAGNMRSGQFSK